MLTNKIEILQEIVDRDGDCDTFAVPAICKRCPLGNKIVNGRKANCMDFLNISIDMASEQVDEIYKKAAEEEIFAINLEEHLSE